jgi:hypothetical protein
VKKPQKPVSVRGIETGGHIDNADLCRWGTHIALGGHSHHPYITQAESGYETKKNPFDSN